MPEASVNYEFNGQLCDLLRFISSHTLKNLYLGAV
jgi:hypothetical protein